MSLEKPDMTEAFTAFLGSVLPERGGELRVLIRNHRISFGIDEDAERILFTSQARPTGSQPIMVGRKCLARLWAQCFSAFLALKLFDERRQGGAGGTRFPVVEWQLSAADEALTWAMRADVNIKYAERFRLPFTAPAPPESLFRTLRGSGTFVVAMAERLFRYALAFLLLHEVHHILQGDVKIKLPPDATPEEKLELSTVSILQEKSADRAAAAWLLGGADLPEDDLLLRRMGVAVALLWPAATRVYIDHSVWSHPPDWDRLFQTLNQYLDEFDPIWGFVVICLLLHLRQAGQLHADLPDLAPDRDSVNLLLDLLARLHG